MSKMYNQKIGKLGEKRAEELLLQHSYQILQKNFQTKFGEIDIIALDGTTLVFVEVKCRSSKIFGEPYEAVNFKKLRQIERAGEIYQFLHKDLPKAIRVDVVSILLFPSGEVQSAELLKDVCE